MLACGLSAGVGLGPIGVTVGLIDVGVGLAGKGVGLTGTEVLVGTMVGVGVLGSGFPASAGETTTARIIHRPRNMMKTGSARLIKGFSFSLLKAS